MCVWMNRLSSKTACDWYKGPNVWKGSDLMLNFESGWFLIYRKFIEPSENSKNSHYLIVNLENFYIQHIFIFIVT